MADRKKPEWMQIGEDYRRARGWEVSDTLSLQIPPLSPKPPSVPAAKLRARNRSLTRIRRLRTAQRQLERARATVEAVLGDDYTSSVGERLLDGFEIADHQLDVAIQEINGE